ncbi:hypothetical protein CAUPRSCDRAFT_12781 [Caulochytrium protostelioides]|uniref:Uncharacterized protein n=1 Tax=Caulochytrium protostelioides TaxID=1555241 RepID=A0A4P9WVV4_9FUNG|nr:hypothetical protein CAUPRSCDRAFT_12781 [Caulochytrium protostelioides]
MAAACRVLVVDFELQRAELGEDVGRLDRRRHGALGDGLEGADKELLGRGEREAVERFLGLGQQLCHERRAAGRRRGRRGRCRRVDVDVRRGHEPRRLLAAFLGAVLAVRPSGRHGDSGKRETPRGVSRRGKRRHTSPAS